MTNATNEAGEHVELTHGTILAEERHDALGYHPVLDHVGETWFFVDAIEADGGRIPLWSGPSYERAILEAEESTLHGWGSVHDLVGRHPKGSSAP